MLTDITGLSFNGVSVIRRDLGAGPTKHSMWLCLLSCGHHHVVHAQTIKRASAAARPMLCSQCRAASVITFDGDLALVPLGNSGLFATIDRQDAERVSPFKWRVYFRPSMPHLKYAVHRPRCPETGRQLVVFMHRLLLTPAEDQLVDHRDGNGLLNTRKNLRIADHTSNSRNRRANHDGAKGTVWHPQIQKWSARIRAGAVQPDGRRAAIHLGLFADRVSAARAYDAAAVAHFGEFARLNFPRELAHGLLECADDAEARS